MDPEGIEKIKAAAVAQGIIPLESLKKMKSYARLLFATAHDYTYSGAHDRRAKNYVESNQYLAVAAQLRVPETLVLVGKCNHSMRSGDPHSCSITLNIVTASVIAAKCTGCERGKYVGHLKFQAQTSSGTEWRIVFLPK